MKKSLQQKSDDELTRQLNLIYEKHSSKLDTVLHTMQLRSLPKEEVLQTRIHTAHVNKRAKRSK